jgi:hypothetical protein
MDWVDQGDREGSGIAVNTLTIYPGTVFLCDLWRMGGI